MQGNSKTRIGDIWDCPHKHNLFRQGILESLDQNITPRYYRQIINNKYIYWKIDILISLKYFFILLTVFIWKFYAVNVLFVRNIAQGYFKILQN